jgi:hypothetical protein
VDDGPNIYVRTPDNVGIDSTDELPVTLPREIYELRWDGLRWTSFGPRATSAATRNGGQLIESAEVDIPPGVTKRVGSEYILPVGESAYINAFVTLYIAGNHATRQNTLIRSFANFGGTVRASSTQNHPAIPRGTGGLNFGTIPEAITNTNDVIRVQCYNNTAYPMRARVVRTIDKVANLSPPSFDIMSYNWTGLWLPGAAPQSEMITGWSSSKLNAPSLSRVTGHSPGSIYVDGFNVPRLDSNHEMGATSNPTLSTLFGASSSAFTALWFFRATSVSASADTAGFIYDNANKWGMTHNANGFTSYLDDGVSVKTQTLPCAINEWRLGMSKLQNGMFYAGLDGVWSEGVPCGNLSNLATYLKLGRANASKAAYAAGMTASHVVSDDTIAKVMTFLRSIMPTLRTENTFFPYFSTLMTQL